MTTEYERIELTVFVERQDSMDSEENARFANHLVIEALEAPGPVVKYIQINNHTAVFLSDEQLTELFTRRAAEGEA